VPEESRPFTSRGVTSARTSPNVPMHPANSRPVCCISAARFRPTDVANGSSETARHQALHGLHAVREGRVALLRVGSFWRVDVDGFLAGRYRLRQ
jgi:hypothetical protein